MSKRKFSYKWVILIVAILAVIIESIAYFGMRHHNNAVADSVPSIKQDSVKNTFKDEPRKDSVEIESLQKSIKRKHLSSNEILNLAVVGWHKARYFRDRDGYNYPVFPVGYKLSSDESSIFIATFVPSTSSGWIIGYQLFRYDIIKKECKFITDGAAFNSDKNGIIVLKVRNSGEGEFGYEQTFMLNEQHFNWNGSPRKPSNKEISEENMLKRYFVKLDKAQDAGDAEFEERGYYVRGFSFFPSKYREHTNEEL